MTHLKAFILGGGGLISFSLMYGNLEAFSLCVKSDAEFCIEQV